MQAQPAPKKKTTSKVTGQPAQRSPPGMETTQSPAISAPGASSARKLVPGLKPTEITGDRSVDDFCKWIRNLGHNGSGHFEDFESCDYVSKEVETKIKKMGGYVGETNDGAFLNWIEEVLGANFVSADACRDFVRQVAVYLSIDEFIGVKP